MKKVRHLFIALVGMMALMACSSSDDGGASEVAEVEWGTGSYSALRKDVNMSDMETLVEYVAKVENLKLQTIKLFSKNWEGELFCGDMTNANPDAMFKLMTELLNNKERYEAAFLRLEASGVLANVTTRGLASAAGSFLGGLYDVVNDEEDRIMQALHHTKMIGNKQAMDELFDVLLPEHRAGCQTSTEWFTKLINHDLTNLSHEIQKTWYESALGVTNATVEYHENYNKVTGTKDGNAIWAMSARTTKELATKGMNVELAVLDELTGGAVSSMQDRDAVLKEIENIRQKYKNGPLKSSDLTVLETMVGKNFVDKVLEEFLLPEEYNSISETLLEEMKDELSDYVYDKEMEAAEEDAAKGTSKSIIQILKDNLLVGDVVSCASDGSLTVGLPNKDGNVTLLTDAGKEQTITTVTKDGERSTQKVTPKAGNNEVKANPDPYDFEVELDPSSVEFDARIGTRVVVVRTNYNYFTAKSNNDWITIKINGQNVLIEVKENATNQIRKGSVTVSLSQDKKTFLKTATIDVIQEAEPDDADLTLSYINPDKLMIEKMIQVSLIGYFHFDDYTTIYPEDIQVKELSDIALQVKGTYHNSMAYHYDRSTISDNTIDPAKDYGVHYEISFTIEAIPLISYGDTYNSKLKDIKIKGYRKDLDEHGYGDYLYEYEVNVPAAYLEQYNFNPNSFADYFSAYGDEYPTVTATTKHVKKWYEDEGYMTDDGWVSKWVVKSETYTNTQEEPVLDIHLRWD